MKAPFGLKPRLSSMGVVGSAHPVFLGKQCALREARRMAAVRCHSHQNGTAEHGRTTTKTRTMFVADLDMSQDGDVPSTSSRTVTVPANGVVARGSKLGSDSVNGGLVRQSDAQLVKDNRALKEELLKAKADLAVQAHDVQELRSKLAERDRSLQLTKSELIETRISLQEKEVLLQEAYDRLRKATNERAEFRRYLMEAEQELRTTRAELLEWSQGLLDLKNVMEGLDDDLSELVGTSTYAAAMLEIEDNLQHANGSSQSNGFKDLGRMSLDESLSDDEMDDITEALRDLQKLSQQILEEAKEDTAYFK